MSTPPRKPIVIWFTQFVLILIVLTYLLGAMTAWMGYTRGLFSIDQAQGGIGIGAAVATIGALILVATLRQRARRWWVVGFLAIVFMIYPLTNAMVTIGAYPPPPIRSPEELLGAAIAEMARYLGLLLNIVWLSLAHRSAAYLSARTPEAQAEALKAATPSPTTLTDVLHDPQAKPEDKAIAFEKALAEIRAPLMEKLAATGRPVARITLERMTQDDALVSKLGGAPYWRADEELPRDAEGKPLVFLAQINFAEVPAIPGYPREGMLRLFIADNATHGNEYDTPIDDERRPAKATGFRALFVPAPLEEDASRLTGVVPSPTDYMPHTPSQPARMRFALGEEEISIGDAQFIKRIGVDPLEVIEQHAARIGVDESTLGSKLFESGAGHKLGGYPYFTQTDPRGEETRLRLFLQLDTDDDHGLMWGDCGVANFFIATEDLARADFSRLVYNWDCC